MVDPGGVRDEGIDGLRAVAALTVVGYHVATAPATGLTSIGPWVASLGNLAVAVFFAVSGHLLWRPVAAALIEDRPAPDARGFLVRRAMRILPLYWLVLMAAYALDAGRPRDLAEAVRLLTLTHPYVQDGQLAGVFVAWTLVAEVAFSVLVVGLAALLTWAGVGRRGRRDAVVVQVGVIVALVAVAALTRRVVLESPDPWRLGWPPNLLDWFAVGMLVGVARAWRDAGGRLPRLVVLALSVPWLWWLAALEVDWVLTRFPTVPPELTVTHVQGIYLLVALFAGLVLAPVVLGRAGGRSPAALLSTRPLVLLGQASYGIYLWHAVWVKVLERADGLHGYGVRLVVVLALTLPCAWITWDQVERRCVDLGRRWSGRQPITASA